MIGLQAHAGGHVPAATSARHLAGQVARRACARWVSRITAQTLGLLILSLVTGCATDGLYSPLSSQPADPARGRALVANQTRSLCLLCHTAPIPEARFQGNIAPDLTGAGSRWSTAQLRLRLVNPQQINPDTLMPSYFRTDHLHQVATAWRGRPILSGADIEDIVAYLSTLKAAEATAKAAKP